MDFGALPFNIFYWDKIDNDGVKLEEEVNQIAWIIAQCPLDGIVMGKKKFLLAVDIMGLSVGYDLASLYHTLMSNMKFEPGESNPFNPMKELRDEGWKGMYAAREEHYKAAQLRKK